MPNPNTFRLEGHPTGKLWDDATDAARKGYWRRLGELAIQRKRWELNRGLDVSGQKMPPRQKARDDAADGPVLAPHNAASRSQKWLRASTGGQHVTVWWSHGWGKVLGYHAEGVVIGAYRRDVIGLTPAGEKLVYRQAEDWLRRQKPKPKAEPPKPIPQTQAAARKVQRRPLVIVPVGVTARRKPQPRPT